MRKAVILLFFLTCNTIIVFAQPKGIKWTNDLTWIQVLKKARTENKYIFLDCFATWCGPCHEMDRDVYTDSSVGKVMNGNFISVRVQMDKTAHDLESVKKWRADASRIQKEYGINAYPSFLFFSPAGQPLHRSVGYKNSNGFISLLKDALNPEKQYYTLLQNYKPGVLDTSELKHLARNLKSAGGELPGKIAVEYLSRIPQSELSKRDNLVFMCEFNTFVEVQKFAFQYLSSMSGELFSEPDNFLVINSFSDINSIAELILKYLSALDSHSLRNNLKILGLFKNNREAKEIAKKYISQISRDSMFQTEELSFITTFTQTTKDVGFDIFYQNADSIDKVMKTKDYSANTIAWVLYKEHYEDYYKRAFKAGHDSLPWLSVSKSIADSYGQSFAERVELNVRASLYQELATKTNRYWPEYIKYNILRIEKYGTDTSGPQHQFVDALELNNFVFTAIFYHSTDPDQINIGLKWMQGVIRRNPTEPNNIDTYANLLYKAGRRVEAIQWQERAEQLAIEEKMEWMLPSIRDNLAKMKNGQPTWLKEDLN